MKTYRAIAFASLFLASLAFSSDEQPKASIDLGGASTIEGLASHIQTPYDISVTCIGANASTGYVVASKLKLVGVLNRLYLDGEARPASPGEGIPVIRIINFKLSKQLEEQVAGYNISMMNEVYRRYKQNQPNKTE